MKKNLKILAIYTIILWHSLKTIWSSRVSQGKENWPLECSLDLRQDSLICFTKVILGLLQRRAVTRPILLDIYIRVISTLNQFIFLFKSKLHALRGCFVYHCLPTTLAGCLHYMATIQLPKNIQRVKQGWMYVWSMVYFIVTPLSMAEKYRRAILLRK